MKIRTLKEDVLMTFKEYGGWWKLDGMAKWLGVSSKQLKKIWDELEQEDLLEKKKRSKANANSLSHRTAN